MNEDRLRRLHQLRKATTDEQALVVAQNEARMLAAEAAEAESIRRRDLLRAELEAASAKGTVRAETLTDRHHGAEAGVRAAVRFTRRVAETGRLLKASREAARQARTEEERLHVLLVEAMERRQREAALTDEKERDEMATMRRRHALGERALEEGGPE